MTGRFDTSGEVLRVYGLPYAGQKAADVMWRDLDPLTQGYIEALFADFNKGRPPRRSVAHVANRLYPFGFFDLAGETLTRIIADCRRADSLQAFRDGVAYSGSHGGGAVFRDRQAGKLERHGLRPLIVEIGEDGKVRFAPDGTHHLTVNGSPWCDWTGCKAGQDINAKAGDIRCGQPSGAQARKSAAALRPFFKPGSVRVVAGPCPSEA